MRSPRKGWFDQAGPWAVVLLFVEADVEPQQLLDAPAVLDENPGRAALTEQVAF